MSWILFDEYGNRAQKLTWLFDSRNACLGWNRGHAPETSTNVFGFLPERSWRPTFFAARMAQGYRVFELDVGEYEYVESHLLPGWWEPATLVAFDGSPPVGEKRLPNIAAVEMWVRFVGART